MFLLLLYSDLAGPCGLLMTIQLAAHEQNLKTTNLTINALIQLEAHVGVYSRYFNIVLALQVLDALRVYTG